jgi:pyruvate dehydrogenase E2 component (dihydrolipoamide acetyltransferase)
MAEAIIMPKTGMAMTEGVIIEWLVSEGDAVSAGDPLAEIETDKSSMQVEAESDGTILRILYEPGATVPVVETIAWIGDPGETPPETPPETAAEGDGHPPRRKATPAARRIAMERKVSLSDISATGRRGEIRADDVRGFEPVRATHLARRIAESNGIDLSSVDGTGRGGTIRKRDLEGLSGDRRFPLTTIQKITGERMTRSHQEIPAVSMDIPADVTEMLEVRRRINESIPEKISINDIVLKAAAMALREHERINAVLDGDHLIFRREINIGMAVATDRGLLVPVISEADRLSLRELSRRASDLAHKAREGGLSALEMEGGTFTVTNIGKFGVTSFTPIINQPQAAILGVCAIEDKVRIDQGSVEVRKVMGLSLRFDHRVVDGAEAASFFSRVRNLLENPLLLMA